MAWPSPELVLYVLGAFVTGYGVSLAIRASRARRWKGTRDTCPECNRPWPRLSAGPAHGEHTPAAPESPARATHAPAPACASCGARPPAPSAVRAAIPWTIGGVLVSIAGVCVFLLGLVVAEWLDQEVGDFRSRGGVGRIGPVLGGGFGLSLFGLYVTIVGYRGQRPKGRRRCPRCWYLIDPALGLKCSECGLESRRERDLYRPRRRWKVATLGLFLVAIGQLGWMESRVRRGGWLAAVPMEVLIVGMPWVPQEWLIRSGPGRGEDWTLSGRIRSRPEREGAGSWTWHQPWAADRAAAWVRSARAPGDALARFALLQRLQSPPWSSEAAPAAHAALIHAATLGIDHIDDPDDPSAGMLLEEVYGRAWNAGTPESRSPVPQPEMAAIVNTRRAELLAVLENGPDHAVAGAVAMLGLGDGPPEVVGALLDRAGLSSGATISLGWLAVRDGRALQFLLEVIEDPSDTRRVAAIRAIAWTVQREPSARNERAIVAALGDEDHAVALTAAAALGGSTSAELRLAAFDRILALVALDPSVVTMAGDCLSYYTGEMMLTREQAVLAMSRHPDAQVRSFFVGLVVEYGGDRTAPMCREAIRLIDSGVALPPWSSSWRIPQIREIARPQDG